MMIRSLPYQLLIGSMLVTGIWAQTPVPTLRANTRIVVVDVVVTDAKQNPVRNLKPSDFTVVEKGQPQAILHFEQHEPGPAGPVATLAPKPKILPGTFTNEFPVNSKETLNVLLLDALNTPMKDQAYVRQQVLKYLETPHAAARMAIFGLNGQLQMLQGFTSDPNILRAVVSGKRNLGKASPLMDNAVSGDSVAATTKGDSMIEMLPDGPGMIDLAANLKQFEAEQKSYQDMQRAGYTLDALNQLGRY